MRAQNDRNTKRKCKTAGTDEQYDKTARQKDWRFVVAKPVCCQSRRGESGQQVNDRARSKQVKVENNRSAGNKRDGNADCIEQNCTAVDSLQLAGGRAKPIKCKPANKC